MLGYCENSAGLCTNRMSPSGSNTKSTKHNLENRRRSRHFARSSQAFGFTIIVRQVTNLCFSRAGASAIEVIHVARDSYCVCIVFGQRDATALGGCSPWPVSCCLRWRAGRRHGRRSWAAPPVLGAALLALWASALAQIALWAGAFVLSGEFGEFEEAFYHSAVNFTTLGYGDIVMSRRWRLLGPLEAVNGSLMLGLSAAMLFTILGRIAEARAPRNRP